MKAPRGRWLGEFRSGAEVLAAARAMQALGHVRLDILAPCELPDADEVLGEGRPRSLPRLVLAAALLGALGAYLIQWWTNAVAYPIAVGGRPLHAAPAFVPIAFEMAVLLGTFAAVAGLVVTARLGRLWQPEFEIADFERVTRDRYWLVIEDGPGEWVERARCELEEQGPLRIERIEAPP